MDKNYKKNLQTRYRRWSADHPGHLGNDARQKLKHLTPNSPKYQNFSAESEGSLVGAAIDLLGALFK
jgi:hypothetical protein